MKANEMTVGGLYECWVNGRPLVVKVLSIVPFGGTDGIKITFQDAKRPGRKMERGSVNDFRSVQPCRQSCQSGR